MGFPWAWTVWKLMTNLTPLAYMSNVRVVIYCILLFLIHSRAANKLVWKLGWILQGWIGQRIGHGPVSVLSSAALAGATSTAILHPLEVVRSRMTCDQVGRYSHGVGAAFRTIAKKEGPLTLYTGLGPTLAAIIPEAAISYGKSCLSVLPACCMRTDGSEEWPFVVAAAFAAFDLTSEPLPSIFWSSSQACTAFILTVHGMHCRVL